jgi:UDP:flavonoid glycosyltransferase YjiC (YdhE family)
MRVLLSTSGGRGDVEPLVALAVAFRALGHEARVCAPPDCADRLAEAGVPLVEVGESVRAMMHGSKPPSPGDAPRLAAAAIATQFDKVPAAAEGCDMVVATGLLSAAVAVWSVAEKLEIPYFYGAYCPIYLPSPHYPPPPALGRPAEPDVTDNRTLWDMHSRGAHRRFGGPLNERRAALGLPPVENIYRYGFTGRPLLAADPILAPLQPTDLDVVQTGAWILPDRRPLPAELEAFLDGGAPPVYVGFGSGPAPADAARVAIEAIRAHGHRTVLSRGWAGLYRVDERDDCFVVGEVNHQALFPRTAAVVHAGSAGTTTAVVRAGVPQVVVPQMTDQPYFAGRVAELGIGVAHDGRTPTFDSLSVALDRALRPGTRERAAAVAGTIRADGAPVAARLLLDVASRERPSVSA